MRFGTGGIFILGILLLFVAGMHPVMASSPEDDESGALQNDPVAVVAHWSKLIARQGHPRRIEAFIRRGEAYRFMGRYRDAQLDFRDAQIAARQKKDQVFENLATQMLGQVLFLQGESAEAERILLGSLEQATRLRNPLLEAASANKLGSVLASREIIDEAGERYELALALARQAGDPGLIAAVHCNRARLLDGEEAVAELRAAQETAAEVAFPRERARLLLGIAAAAQDVAAPVFREQVLVQALDIAAKIDEPRLKSLASGYLAAFQEDLGYLAKSQALTEQAIWYAQTLEAQDLLLCWEGQLGRLMRKQGDSAAAIAAYRRAIYHFERSRQDIACQGSGASFFEKKLSPIYLGLADLLLRQAAAETDEASEQMLLREARDTVEKIRVSELQDYMRDPCIVAKTENIETLSPGTAVLYPIVLPDRLELLMSIGRRLYRKTSSVDKEHLADAARSLSYRFRGGLSFQFEASKIYKWLVQPVIPMMEENNIDTLVFVPDGPLRLIPIGALGDGGRYLVERFAIVFAPGLTMLDPKPLPRKRLLCLLAGLSQPGPVVDNLPDAMLTSLLRGSSWQAQRGMRGMPITTRGLSIRMPAISESTEPGEQQARVAQVIEKLKLPGVKEEIIRLSQQLEARVLLDNEFRFERFANEVESQPYRVVHIASHGFFGGSVEDSFILTYDDKLDINRLAGLLQPKRFAQKPVEILVLSACQTAEGNDRTPLGLSGVAIKSGARSAVGSLWPVYDEVARKLLPEFYARLDTPGVTKAQALQKVQMELIASEKYSHPTFWASFILVGNWL